MGKNYFKRKLCTIVLLLTTLSACSWEDVRDKYIPPPHLASEETKGFYALGRIVGVGLKKFHLSEQELWSVYKGMYDETLQIKTHINTAAYEKKLSELFTIKQSLQVTKNILRSTEYIKKHAIKGYIITDKNLLKKIIIQGKAVDTQKNPFLSLPAHRSIMTLAILRF